GPVLSSFHRLADPRSAASSLSCFFPLLRVAAPRLLWESLWNTRVRGLAPRTVPASSRGWDRRALLAADRGGVPRKQRGGRLARHLQKEAQAQHNNSEFTEEQKKTIGKIATCLELRSAALQSTQSQEEFKLEDLKKLEPILKNILTYNKEFPFDVQPVPLRRILAPGEEENLEIEDDEDEGGAGAGAPDSFPARVPGTLLPRLPSEPGMTLLTIRIEKIGLKDAGQCIDPYITVSVKDLNGIDLTPVQDTPVASRKEDTYVHFNVDIELQKHVEKLTKGAAIFFEFKHYKPKKRFTSTKCFAFMEMDEIRPGPIVIELYKKPTDFKRKKLQLLTKKPLYLHLHQTLHKE
uniref:Axin interactor, dorsalization-associated protein n=2 Tax=Sus scrofa TaxID=9823 RepID=A0A8D2A3E5_PIG